MTTTTGRRPSPEQVRQIRAVVATAEEMGCQLLPSPARPSYLKGLCPFHQVTANGDRNSLEVNTDNGRFYCAACGAQGNPMAFMALVWGVSAQDANILFEANPDARSQRPAYPDSYYQSENGRPRPQNTALLGKAAAHYASQLRLHYEPLQFLAFLGVTPEKAEALGVGYCPGGTLAAVLANDEIPPALTPEEIADTRLLHPVTGHEIFTGRLTLADQDYLGACLWMTSLRLETEAYEQGPWPKDRPTTYGLPGARQYLLNAYTIDRQRGEAVLTDDLRLYILLAAEGLPAVLMTQRRRPDTEPRQIADRTVAALKRREVQKLAIVNHDVSLRDMIQKSLAPDLGAENIKTFNKELLLQTLDRSSRNLEQFLDFSSNAAPAAVVQRRAQAAATAENEEQPAADSSDTEAAEPAADAVAATPRLRNRTYYYWAPQDRPAGNFPPPQPSRPPHDSAGRPGSD